MPSVEKQIEAVVAKERNKKKPTKIRLTVDVTPADNKQLNTRSKELGISKTRYLALLVHEYLNSASSK